jgi:acetyl-CoA acetyltransferase
VSSLASAVGHPEFENPFGPTVPSLYALIARRHMATHGTTPEALASVAVACREHAAKRGAGQETDRIDVDDVLTSPLIASPLHKLECALISDCAGAVVVSSAEAAQGTRDPVELTGYGEGHGTEYVHRRGDLLETPAAESGATAFEMAGRTPGDVDVAQLYDCFSITPLVLLEDLGFCEKGGGGAFVTDRGITTDGELPVNTHGGELSYAGAGVFHVLEAVRQVRGEAAATQVDTDVALAHGVGGVLSTNATLLLEAW